MGENFAFREGDIQSFIDIVDNDRDGKISKAEMVDFIMDLFNSMWGNERGEVEKKGDDFLLLSHSCSFLLVNDNLSSIEWSIWWIN